ncbi:MAG: ABC transporter ATP-binding protein [Clostridia bacterium]|nr:ABC transporter ATP-binding protein [Clostridia bacterium]
MSAEGKESSEAEERALLRVREARKLFGGFAAVDGVSLDVREGEIVGLIGPNGAGKTTLFSLITLFLPLTSGAVYFRGQRIDGRPPYLPARLGLVRTFQITRVFARMTVLENLMFAAPGQPGESLAELALAPRRVRAHERRVRERADELLRYFNLERVRDQYAGTLSGGQRKLLEMARALMTEPKLMLLDEPMAGVNPTLKEELLGYVLDLRRQGMTFLVIEHDLDMIMRISDRVVAMAEGRVISEGPPEAVRQDPAVVDAYLGPGGQARAAPVDPGPPAGRALREEGRAHG